MTKTQKLKIQKIAQRFIALCYQEFRNPKASDPVFDFSIGKYEVNVFYSPVKKRWICAVHRLDMNMGEIEI